MTVSFWTNVMLKQPRVRASRASPTQKLQGLRLIYSKNFSRATFFVFWGSHFELFAREKNLEKKCSVHCCAIIITILFTKFLNSLNIPSVSMDANAPRMCRELDIFKILGIFWEFFWKFGGLFREFFGRSLGILWQK